MCPIHVHLAQHFSIRLLIWATKFRPLYPAPLPTGRWRNSQIPLALGRIPFCNCFAQSFPIT